MGRAPHETRSRRSRTRPGPAAVTSAASSDRGPPHEEGVRERRRARLPRSTRRAGEDVVADPTFADLRQRRAQRRQSRADDPAAEDRASTSSARSRSAATRTEAPRLARGRGHRRPFKHMTAVNYRSIRPISRQAADRRRGARGDLPLSAAHTRRGHGTRSSRRSGGSTRSRPLGMRSAADLEAVM